MFAHHVIEDFRGKISRGGYDELYSRHHAQCIQRIVSAQHFDLGDMDDFPVPSCGKFPMMIESGGAYPAIYSDLTGVRLPYKTCWLDCRLLCLKDRHDKLVNASKVDFFKTKTGIVVEEIDEDTIGCYLCSYNTPRKIWSLLPHYCLIHLGKDYSKDGGKIFCSEISDDASWVAFGDGSDNMVAYFVLIGQFMDIVCAFLQLMSCSNIGSVKNYPPSALNKKRLKHHKQPLFSYHTLVIKPSTKKGVAVSSQHLWNNRVHLCRGHFKTYTEDNPLFGRVKGRFWWQPSLRGRSQEGVVIKDYKIKSNAA